MLHERRYIQGADLILGDVYLLILESLSLWKHI
jgi:hypothetical protein